MPSPTQTPPSRLLPCPAAAQQLAQAHAFQAGSFRLSKNHMAPSASASKAAASSPCAASCPVPPPSSAPRGISGVPWIPLCLPHPPTGPTHPLRPPRHPSLPTAIPRPCWIPSPSWIRRHLGQDWQRLFRMLVSRDLSHQAQHLAAAAGTHQAASGSCRKLRASPHSGPLMRQLSYQEMATQRS